MAEKDLLIREKLDHSGIFDFASLYTFTHSWLKDEGYSVKEEKYSEKVSDGRTISFEWKASKTVTDYFKIELSVKAEVSELKDVEVEQDGKKKRMNKGKVSFDLKGTLITDYESKWESSPQMRFFRSVYDKYIIPSRIDSMQGKVVGDVSTLKEEIKAFLELLGRR